ncbi:YeeE/YedE thiosulfate transporter family protein [Galenea microaerophila]
MKTHSTQYGALKSLWLTLYNFIHAHRNNLFGWLFGILFGFLMSKAGATTYDFHAKMFLLQDFQLMIVIITAVITAMIGVTLLKVFKVNAVATGEAVDFVKKPYQKGLITGAFLFGIGWAMTASCPGTIPAMMGEGKLGAFFAFVGLVLGTLAYGILKSYMMQNRFQD